MPELLIIDNMTPDEVKYSYAQSQQLSMQTGLIGYLRADMGSNGNEFFSTWNGFNERLNTQEFKDQFDDVINHLREDGNLLHDRNTLRKECYKLPPVFGDDSDYRGIRVNTEQYSYLLRVNPNKGEYNLYCHCYESKWLNHHMEQATNGIRFINSNYKELFHINDGDKIIITASSGEKHERICRYIDSYHTEVGNNLYHICEFAERMEAAGSTYEPEKSILPRECYGLLHTGEMIIIKYGEKGYFNTDIPVSDKDSMRELCNEMNSKLGVTKPQAAAMLAGSMYGWCVPAANPKNYDENGKAIKPKEKYVSRDER